MHCVRTRPIVCRPARARTRHDDLPQRRGPSGDRDLHVSTAYFEIKRVGAKNPWGNDRAMKPAISKLYLGFVLVGVSMLGVAIASGCGSSSDATIGSSDAAPEAASSDGG